MPQSDLWTDRARLRSRACDTNRLSACRLLTTLPADGAWNMAVDEALLDQAVEGLEPVLRFYSWRVATISLGYFQPYRDILRHPEFADLPIVRRMTGGGAILHDQEITYALVLPAGYPLARDPTQSYCRVHKGIAEALRSIGQPAEVQGWRGATPNHGPEPFLCLLRRGPADVFVDANKVVGSAQRRRRGALLQHGSLLLKASSDLPTVAGLVGQGTGKGKEELRAPLMPLLARCISQQLGFALQPGELTGGEVTAAESRAQEKYANPKWTHCR